MLKAYLLGMQGLTWEGIDSLLQGGMAVMGMRRATTAPIEPPSRTNTGSRPNAKFIASFTASARGPVVGAL